MGLSFDSPDVLRLPPPPRWLRWLAVAVVAGGLFVASVVTPPSSGVPTLGPLDLVGFDKWLHTAAYAALGATLFLALVPLRRPRRALVAAVVLAAVYGVGIELVQGPLPARSTDSADALANGLGAGLGGLAGLLARRLSTPFVADDASEVVGRDAGVDARDE
ncbi:VanZ like family protein [Halogranum amylolyticum]|uniref:VanZ like family protein n=1 Tax=Halogranum amylolyticum TaxID=660520 RepID=A0A1H8N5B0_9EURY|nr:VanZ family protein [Halogranum amylolyticum]SEO24742.1 VanZ like family protein [Halogranum amylolyticum]